MRPSVLALLLCLCLILPASANQSVAQGSKGVVNCTLMSRPSGGSQTWYISSPSGASYTGTPAQNNAGLPADGSWGVTYQSGGVLYVQVPQTAAATSGYRVEVDDGASGYSGYFDVAYVAPSVGLDHLSFQPYNISPSTVPVGGTVSGQVTLNQAVSSNTSVALSLKGTSGGTASVSFPSAVTVPSGSASVNFNVLVNSYGSTPTTVTVEATVNGSTYDATITLTPSSSSGGSSGASQNLTVWAGDRHWVFDPNNEFQPSIKGQYVTILPGSGLLAGTYQIAQNYYVANYNTNGQGVHNVICLTQDDSTGALIGAAGASGGTYTISSSAPVSPPGVSIMVTPTSLVAGASATLTWTSSGATSVTVTGQISPASSGSVSVSPTETTTYTVTATNSGGTTAQSCTLTVTPASGSGSGGSQGPSSGCLGSSAGCGDGDSTWLPIQGLIGSGSPGDLKIGIPGIGSFKLPSGWWTQIIAYAMASQNMTGGFLQNAMNAAANFTTQHIDSGFLGTQQIISTVGTDMQNVVNVTSTATQKVIDTGTSRIIGVTQSVEKVAVDDFKAMIQGLFVPDASCLQQFQNEKDQFLDWGPYHFVTAFQNALLAAPGDGKIAGVGLDIPALSVNTSSGYSVVATQTSSGAPAGAGVVAPYTWYATGQKIPINVSQVTNAPGWATVRLMFGGIIWVIWGAGLVGYLMPKQVV